MSGTFEMMIQEAFYPQNHCISLQDHTAEMLARFVSGHIAKMDTRMTYCPEPIQRDFRNLYISRSEHSRVMSTPNAYALMSSTGSGAYVTWYLYHSVIPDKVFMVWFTNGDHYGCRDDLGRITIYEDIDSPN